MHASEEPIKTAAEETARQPMTQDPVCNFLLNAGRLKPNDLKRAVTYRDQHGGDLVTLLVRLGLVSERDVAEAEAGLLDLPL
ncbi:MAG: type II secretion system protein GspE, partial [Xanthomonadales bacterium]|nr:type II secretion system protein GspE [Xanthomonadales bacterium]